MMLVRVLLYAAKGTVMLVRALFMLLTALDDAGKGTVYAAKGTR
jgi:hypothetical protein